MMRTISLLVAGATLLTAHSISVSTGEGQLEGRRLHLVVKIPKFEAEDLLAKGGNVGAAIRFAGASLAGQSCAYTGEDYQCQLEYTFAADVPERLRTEVELARLTVPNHVHILRLTRSGVMRQGIFDRTFEADEINFHEAGKGERYWRTIRQGMAQLALQPLALLLLVALALYVRPIPYLLGGVAAFLVVLPDQFYATPAFFELATAIAICYLASERWLFPQAGAAWAPALVIGLIEGAGLAVLARPSGEMAVAYGLANFALQGVLSFSLWHYVRTRRTPIPPWIWKAMLAVGACWSVWVFAKRF